MDSNYVSFEIAKKLKDFGYPQEIEFWDMLPNNSRFYFPDGACEKRGCISEYIEPTKLIAAPTLDEVTRWFRKEHKIDILPYRHTVGNGGYYDDKYMCSIIVPPMFFERENDNKEYSGGISSTAIFDSFDDAVADSITFMLEVLENKRNGWKKQ